MFNDLGNNLLTVLIFLPLLGAAIVALLPKGQPSLARWVALLATVPTLLLAIGIFYNVYTTDPSASGYHYQFTTEWFPQIGSNWAVGVDGISMSMILLTAILTPLAILIAFEHDDNPRAVLALILFLQMAMMGVFATTDMVAFFIFWELGLVPMYFLINQWGGANRGYASMKFFIYTMAGSLGLLLALQLIAYLVGQANGAEAGITFNYLDWLQIWPTLGRGEKLLGFNADVVKYFTFLSFFVAFSIKIPVWPFHTWLPDAHTEAPTAGSMLLAGVLLKQGAYGFIRFVIPLFPAEFVGMREPIAGLAFSWVEIFAVLAMLGIVMGAFSAWAQDDLKKLVAYSSVNHMGFVVLGLAAGAVVYGTLWAQSPQVEDPLMALSMVRQNLEDSDIETYHLATSASSIEALSDPERIELAQLKLEELGYSIAGASATEEHIETAPSEGEDDSHGATVTIGKTPQVQNANVAMNGAVLQMFNHGLSSAAMFLLVGALYHKAHTRDLRRFGGLWHIIPVYGFLFVFTSMASLGLPGLNGFTSEWLVVSGSFPIFPIIVLVSMLGLFLTGAYILKGIQKVLHGPVNPEWVEYHHNHHSLEINFREIVAMVPLVVLMLVTGIYPNWILHVIDGSVTSMFTAFLGR